MLCRKKILHSYVFLCIMEPSQRDSGDNQPKSYIMTKTYAITTASNTIRYVAASSRQAACLKLTGMRETAAMAAKQILGIKLCKAD